jgi:hypothetical protein
VRFRGAQAGVPDLSGRIPVAAVALRRLRHRTEEATARYAMSGELNLAVAERQPLLTLARANVAAARGELSEMLRVTPDTAAELLMVLGWPWSPADLAEWEAGKAALAFSRVPAPLLGWGEAERAAARRGLERSAAWREAAAGLEAAGWTAEETAALRVWSGRLALAEAWDSDRALARAERRLSKFFDLTPFQSRWVVALAASDWALGRGRFALGPAIGALHERPETLVLVRELVREGDFAAEAKREAARLGSGRGAEAAGAEARLRALGPVALGALAAVEGPGRERAERVRNLILSDWPPSDLEGELPAGRWECWARWHKAVRPGG